MFRGGLAAPVLCPAVVLRAGHEPLGSCGPRRWWLLISTGAGRGLVATAGLFVDMVQPGRGVRRSLRAMASTGNTPVRPLAKGRGPLTPPTAGGELGTYIGQDDFHGTTA